LTIRDSQARLDGGRAHLEGTLNWGNALRLVGRLLFYQVELRALLREEPSLSAYASGRLSGRIDLAGSEMHSVNDLIAVVAMKLEQGQAKQLPVLRHIIPYLGPRAQASTFQTGSLRGRLARGVFRIERAILFGDFLRMFIVGTINLAGNLDLEVTARTGLYLTTAAGANAIIARIPVAGSIPRLVLNEANALLSALAVHLRVTGTVHAPVIRIEPLLTFTEDAVRFFLGRAIGLDIPNFP
jgi:hypothetical protein